MVDQALVKLLQSKQSESAALMHAAFAKFPDLKSSADLSLLGLLARLHPPETEPVAAVILREHPNLPPALFYYGLYLESSGRPKEAVAQFQNILSTFHKARTRCRSPTSSFEPPPIRGDSRRPSFVE